MKRKGFIAAAMKAALVVSAMVCGLLLTLLITDIHEDRAYRLVISGPVTLYADPVLPDHNYANRIMTVLGPHDEVEVLRISREEGWVRVRLPDRREGYIFLDSPIELRRR